MISHMKSDLKTPALAGLDRKATIASSSVHLPHALTHRGGDMAAAATADGVAKAVMVVAPAVAPAITTTAMAMTTHIDHSLGAGPFGVRAGCLSGRREWLL